MPSGMIEPAHFVRIAEQTRPIAREVFGNIPDRQQTLFYILALVALILLGIGIGRRARLWRLGHRRGTAFDRRKAARQFVVDVLWQRWRARPTWQHGTDAWEDARWSRSTMLREPNATERVGRTIYRDSNYSNWTLVFPAAVATPNVPLGRPVNALRPRPSCKGSGPT